jgi:hypothetical protein
MIACNGWDAHTTRYNRFARSSKWQNAVLPTWTIDLIYGLPGMVAGGMG